MENLTVSEFIGKRIREIRKEQNMTIRQLADAISEKSGESYSESMISMWESGKRRIYADQLWYICRVLKTNPTHMFPVPIEHDVESTIDEVKSFREEEYNIFLYMLTSWNGNVNALIQFIGLYMSLPKQLRQDIAGMGIHMYELGLKEHKVVKDAPKIDFDYLKDTTDKLWKWKQSEL